MIVYWGNAYSLTQNVSRYASQKKRSQKKHSFPNPSRVKDKDVTDSRRFPFPMCDGSPRKRHDKNNSNQEVPDLQTDKIEPLIEQNCERHKRKARLQQACSDGHATRVAFENVTFV